MAFNPFLQTDLRDIKAQGANVGNVRNYNGTNYAWSGVEWQPTGGGGGGGTGTSGSWEDTVKRAITMQQEANQPAIASYQAQIPEIQKGYAAQKVDITAKEQTLKDRYDTLLKSLGTSQTKETSAQQVITQNELGKRGLLPSSTLAQQEVQNVLTPITDKYTNLQRTTELDRTAGLQDLAGLITQLTTGESADTRAITNAIAQLQSGAATSGITTGTNVWGQNQTNIANQAASSYKAQQDAISNAIAQGQLANQTAKTQYDINAPYFKPESNGDGLGVTTAQWLNSQGQAWTDTTKTPVGTFKGKDGKTYTRYSDGSSGKTVWNYQ